MAGNIYSIAIALLSIMFSVGGILLGLGFALNDKKLRQFGQDELIQTIINSAILGIIFLIFLPNGFAMKIIEEMLSGANLNATCEQMLSSNPAICFASAYLVGSSPIRINGVAFQSLLAVSTEMLASVSTAYVAVAIISAIKLNFIVGISLSALFAPLLNQLSRLITMLTTAIIGIEAQAILLKFIALTAVQLILPVGMLLRIVYFTRRLGGALIAIAIGLFCVMPLTYAFNAELTYNYSTYSNETAITNLATLLNETGQNAGSGLQGYSGANLANNSNSTGIVSGFISFAGKIYSMFMNAIKKVLNFVALLIVEVFLLPLFSAVLTVISIREIARILGSEVMTEIHWGYI
ncbi:MAG: hypothetical protein ACP5SA_02345 [Candidatus Micrarchaeia archaeon]